MKKIFKRAISVMMAIVMLLSAMTAAFPAFAEESSAVAVPDIQTMLTDGKILKNYLETNFLSLEKADSLLAENLPSLAQSLCAQLGDLFYQMGYNQEQYPNDDSSLMLALARILSSLDATVFREPEKVETTNMELIYNLAFIGGNDYINSINASLPESVRFDTAEPFLSLTQEQKSEIESYYAKWKSGDLLLDGFDIKNYLGDITPAQFLKAVLLVFIADDNRLPAIAKKAIDFDFTDNTKAALAKAAADILDNLYTAPVSAVLRQLSDSDFQQTLLPIIDIASSVTLRTDYYSYKLFTEGIYTDTDGSLVDFVQAEADGTYSYIGPSLVGEYSEVVNALFDFLGGIYPELEESVLECVFSKRLDKLATLAEAALEAATATVSSQQTKLLSDIKSANIEIRFAQAQIAKIDSGEDKETLISNTQAKLDAVAAEISSLQEQLAALETEEAAVKDSVKGYYEALAEFEAEMTDENKEEIENNPEYIAAKQKVEQTESSLANNYASQDSIKAQIKEKSEKADEYANDISRLENEYSPTDAKTVWNKLISQANDVINSSETALGDLPDKELIDSVKATLSPLVAGFFTALDGVYDVMISQTPVKAIVQLVYGLKDFVDAVENIDWDSISAVTDPIFEQLDGYIDSAAGRYIGENGGGNILSDITETVNTLFNTYGVFDYVNVSSLNTFVSEQILGDNSEIMQQAAAALAEIFPNVEPTYESIVSCLIPLLSAFNINEIMANMDNIAGALQLASPTAFAYLAGLSTSVILSDYLATINSNLENYGYTGERVKPIIKLSEAQAQSLLKYVNMEQNGSTLSEIAAAGFNWKDYTGTTSNLEIANAFVKIALGDSNKLGEMVATPGVGPALVKLLCDLLNDIKSDPVNTILKKISDAESLTAIADMAISMFDGNDMEYMSYGMFFTENIYYDKDENTTFYDMLDEQGNPAYKGPRKMQMYVPVVAAVIDLLSGLYDAVEKNDGDILKTVLYDKVPQLKNVVKSVISYKDENGDYQAGMLFYLLLGYSDFAKAKNEELCYELLKGLSQSKIAGIELQKEYYYNLIEIWLGYENELDEYENQKKAEKAVELGLLAEGTEEYNEADVVSAIEVKKAELAQELSELEAETARALEGMNTAQSEFDAATQLNDDFTAFMDSFYDDPFYSDLCDIFDNEDETLIDVLRDDCGEEFDTFLGEGAFYDFAALIIENLEEFAGDADTFMEIFLFGEDGMDVYTVADGLYEAQKDKKADLAQAQADYEAALANSESKAQELAGYESGAVLEQIRAAGDNLAITISDTDINADGDYTRATIQSTIDSINNEYLYSLNNQIADEQSTIAQYDSLIEEAIKKQAGFNSALVPLAYAASDTLAQGIIDIIMGDAEDGSENIYNYIMNGNVADILSTGGRIQSLIKMIVGIYEPALMALVSEGIISEDTANELISAVPSFEEFYNTSVPKFIEDFPQNPVGALAALINDFTDAILEGFAQTDGKLSHDALQMKKITRDVNNIFDDDFGTEWLESYSKTVVNRTGEVYQLIVDILGLSFIKELLGEIKSEYGAVSGKIDTSKLYSEITVELYSGETLVASLTVSADSDGNFEFKDLEKGTYTIKISTASSVPFEVGKIDVTADETTELTESNKRDVSLLTLPLGDVDGNGYVDVADISQILLADNYGSSSRAGDINSDGITDISDISIILSSGNYGSGAISQTY